MRILTLASRLKTVACLSALLYGLTPLAEGAPTGQPVIYAVTPDNTVTIIDTGNRQVLGTIKLDVSPSYLMARADGKVLYAAGSDSFLRVIDTQTRTVLQTIPLPEDNVPFGMVSSPDGSRVYLLNGYYDQSDSLVSIIDTATNTIVSSIGDSVEGPSGFSISPDGKRIYVALTDGLPRYGATDVIDVATASPIAQLHVGDATDQFAWTAVSPDSSKVYAGDSWCCNGDGGGIGVFDAATFALLKTLPGVATLQIPLPNTSILYGTAGGTVVAFDTLTDQIKGTVTIADSVNNIALSPDSKHLYVSNSNAQSIAILDTATNTVTGSIAVAGATFLTVAATPPPASQPPTVKLTAPSVSEEGLDIGVVWSSTGATSCVAGGELTNPVGLQGSVTFNYFNSGRHTYSLTCSGPGGSAAASVTVVVQPGPTITLGATDIPAGATTTLAWTNPAREIRCVAGGAWNGAVPTNGSTTVGPFPAGNYTFTLGCDDAAGNSSRTQQTLNVFTPLALQYTSVGHAADNVRALASGGSPVVGGMDGHGYAYSAALIPQPFTALGQTFILGDPSGLSGAANESIPLGTTRLASLTFIATGVNGNQPNQPFVVTYGDGTTATITQGLSDWHTPQGYAGESVAVTGGYRIAPDGSHQVARWNLYAYRIQLDPNKVAVSLRLPKTRNVVVLAINETPAPHSTPVPLASKGNIAALSAGRPAAGGGRMDGHGYAYDATLVPATLTVSGESFNIGPADQLDALANATIALPVTNTLSVTLLAAAVNGPQSDQTFVVTYQDGATTSFKQSLSDWGQARSFPGESVAVSTGYRITPAGSRQAGAWRVYAYTFQTDPTRPMKSLTLPKNRDVVVLAIDASSQ